MYLWGVCHGKGVSLSFSFAASIFDSFYCRPLSWTLCTAPVLNRVCNGQGPFCKPWEHIPLGAGRWGLRDLTQLSSRFLRGHHQEGAYYLGTIFRRGPESLLSQEAGLIIPCHFQAAKVLPPTLSVKWKLCDCPAVGEPYETGKQYCTGQC